jgi:hypothetical protein
LNIKLVFEDLECGVEEERIAGIVGLHEHLTLGVALQPALLQASPLCIINL